jgi:hypothetical protein
MSEQSGARFDKGGGSSGIDSKKKFTQRLIDSVYKKAAKDRADKVAEGRAIFEAQEKHRVELIEKYEKPMELFDQLLNKEEKLDPIQLKAHMKELGINEDQDTLLFAYQTWIGDEGGSMKTMEQAVLISQEEAKLIKTLLDAPKDDRKQFFDAIEFLSGKSFLIDFFSDSSAKPGEFVGMQYMRRSDIPKAWAEGTTDTEAPTEFAAYVKKVKDL